MSDRPKPVHELALSEFDALFSSENDCKTYLAARRWPDGVICPRCSNRKIFAMKTMPFKWQCYQCGIQKRSGYRFSAMAGTIFKNTNKPLRDWFKVTYLMLTSKKEINALQIQR
jgi:hypothetical protein